MFTQFNISKKIYFSLRLNNTFIRKLFNYSNKNEINEEIVFSSKTSNPENQNLEKLENSIQIINDNKPNLYSGPINIYYGLISKHYSLPIYYSDDELYKKIFYISREISNNSDLESWDFVEKYILVNYENNQIDLNFIVEVIEQFSKINFWNFEFWYRMEKYLIENIKQLTNYQLAILIYSYSYAERGSLYFYRTFAECVLDRGIRNFNENEFIMIYNGLKASKIKDKLLWAILNKAKEELHPKI